MSPLIWLNSVVLPAPLGPMIRRRSPGRIESDTPCVTFEAAERLVQADDFKREAGRRRGHDDRLRNRAVSFCKPGTIPVGITSTMNRNTRPSSMFQRSI